MLIKKRLLAVQGPLQFIAGHIAMEWYQYIKHTGEARETVLLMYDFLMPEEMEPEFVKVITRLAAPFKWRAIVFISAADMAAMMKGHYSKRLERLKSALGQDTFDELFVARDFCGEGSPLLINAYPNAKRIIYGDAFGLVGNEAVVADRFNWNAPLRSLASRSKSMLLGLFNGTHKRLPFDTAVLSIPLDWSGTYLDGLDLLIPSRDFVINKVAALSTKFDELSRYADLLVDPQTDNYLFLLSNLAASGLLAQESEVELYVEIIKETTPVGATVLLKAHPRGSRFILSRVAEAIQGSYKTVVIDNAEMAIFPIELWARFLKQCVVVPIYSASAYQIKYLYDKEVVLTLNEDRISRFFFPDKRQDISKGNQSIVSCVANIDAWDRTAPLWNGRL
jgi:hypothetical protein